MVFELTVAQRPENRKKGVSTYDLIKKIKVLVLLML